MLAACSPQLTRHPWLSDSRPQAEEKFKQIANAYTVLSDDEKRKVYDMHGEEGIQKGAGAGGGGFGGMDAHEIFKQFFGGENPFGGGIEKPFLLNAATDDERKREHIWNIFTQVFTTFHSFAQVFTSFHIGFYM